MKFNPNRHYDPLTVDALVQRFPVAGATPADRAQAAKILADRGWDNGQIAMLLRSTERHVGHWVNHTEVVPQPPIAEWADREDWPLCSKGLHELTPDNLIRKGFDRKGRQIQICRMCVADYKRDFDARRRSA